MGAPNTGQATNSAPASVTFLESEVLVSGWMVEQSTKSFPLGLDCKAVSIVEVMAASSPTHVKMMSDFETTSSMVLATRDFPDGNVLANSVYRVSQFIYFFKNSGLRHVFPR